MKNTNLLFLLLTVLLAAACKQESEKPKVSYDNSAKPKTAVRVDTTQIEIADLPVQMPGTNYLIFPVGDLNIYGGNPRAATYESAGGNDVRFKISNYSENEIAGYLRNLKFQQIGTDSLRALTSEAVLIQTATYLKTVADKTKQQILAYTLADMDTNKDSKLDLNDIKSLYLSDISGSRFTKISADFQELIDWNLVETQNRLYFRTIEDTNKNGEFDKNDILHYHFVDLSNKDWKVSDYNPIH